MKNNYFEIKTLWKIIIKKKYELIIGLLSLLVYLLTDLHYAGKIAILIVVLGTVGLMVKDAQKINNLEKEKHIPLMVIVGKNDSERNSMISSVLQAMETHGFNEETFEKEFGLERDDWVIRGESILSENPKEWEKLVHKFEDKLNRLGEKLKGHKVYHIFLQGPVVLAAGMGAIMGTKYEVVLYQYSPGTGKNPYQSLIDFHSMRESNPEGVHVLKSRVNPANKFFDTIESCTGSPDMIISIFAATHDPKGDVEKAIEVKTCKKSYSVMHLRSKTPGTLSNNSDWIEVTRELATIILSQVSRKDIKNTRLCISAPIVISFALGMALGIHSPISLCNWFHDKQRYYTVLNLNKLNRSNE
ncbi:SAVED domain-containing protein [Methanosarcina sp. WWM596]|uniref:SAVED domain-containing protein n=1 Tax=Methanosarcina sp. WWM596 TaxID=1434103 RepID=UPI000615CAA6|nr:SAVED domain-containing protein [Methanosarcina sp. WWM596]AKB19467.1 hypothetical protein MSWHS_2604 [Methanosarcina sp. WWM596]